LALWAGKKPPQGGFFLTGKWKKIAIGRWKKIAVIGWGRYKAAGDVGFFGLILSGTRLWIMDVFIHARFVAGLD